MGIEVGCYCVPQEIMDLCKQYYFDADQGIFQLGYTLHSVLKQIKQKSISKKMVRALIKKYLKVKNKRKIMFYLNELIRLKCIEPVQNDKRVQLLNVNKSNQFVSYRIPMNSTLMFDGCK